MFLTTVIGRGHSGTRSISHTLSASGVYMGEPLNGSGDLIPAEENTLADSIAVGVPRNPKKALRAVSASNGAWIAVSDEDILATMGILGRSEGVFGEPAGVTATAGVMKAVQQGIIKPNETVTTISTGSGLKDVKNALRAAGRPHKCAPSIEALETSGII